MADVINMEPPSGGPEELECLQCGSNSFYVFPDSVITCCSCKYIMRINMLGTLYLVPEDEE